MLSMFFSQRRRLKPGWLAVCMGQEGTGLAAVQQVAGRPAVQWVAMEEGADADLAVLAKTRGLAGSRLVTLMPAGSYQIVQMNAPAVPRAEWKDALRWQLKDFIDFPVEQATFDVLEIPTEPYAPGRPSMVYVVVAANAQVASLMQRFDSLRLSLEAIDIPELALRNVAALLEDENRGLALLSFDRSGGLLVITFKGELYASRRIEIPLDQFSLSDQERRQSLFERIGLELQRTLDAFDRQYSFISISRLLLAPRPELGGLLDYLASSLYVPVENMDLSGRIDLSAAAGLQQPVEQSRHLLNIGAALRQEVAA